MILILCSMFFCRRSTSCRTVQISRRIRSSRAHPQQSFRISCREASPRPPVGRIRPGKSSTEMYYQILGIYDETGTCHTAEKSLKYPAHQIKYIKSSEDFIFWKLYLLPFQHFFHIFIFNMTKQFLNIFLKKWRKLFYCRCSVIPSFTILTFEFYV